MKKKLLLIDIAGLSFQHLRYESRLKTLLSFSKNSTIAPLKISFPALTCPVQANITTSELPSKHHIVGNGFYDRNYLRTFFWEQSDNLVKSERIWNTLKKKYSNFTSAILFWQNSINSNNNIILTPAPIHKHHGGMIQSCYSKPKDLYETLVSKIGRFKLETYWGPFASHKSTSWIADAALSVIENSLPDLVLIYFPILDYNQQKFGVNSIEVQEDLKTLDSIIADFLNKLNHIEKKSNVNYDIIWISDYSMNDVKGALFPNKILKEAGFFAVRKIKKMEYIDFSQSKAFAVVDHQIAHIYCNPDFESEVINIFNKEPDVHKIITSDEKKDFNIDSPLSGDIILVSKKDKWFSYHWWPERKCAPDYARHIDIHNKPGYDPLELFFSWKNFGISFDTSLIKASHGSFEDEKNSNGVFISNFKIENSNQTLRDTDVKSIILRRFEDEK